MRKLNEIHAKNLDGSDKIRLFLGFGILVLLLVFLLGANPVTVYAQSQGTMRSTAYIRKEADTGSDVLGSVLQGKTITINKEVTGSDGMVWYQVFLDSENLGYIRSDMVQKSDGSTPSSSTTGTGADSSSTNTGSGTTTDTGTTGGIDGNTAADGQGGAVTQVEPQSATVIGAMVRVRSDASASAGIVVTVEKDAVLTVDGYAAGTDGNTWYRVSFIADGSSVTGYVRSDFVTLAGELVPVTAESPEENSAGEEDETGEPEEVIRETKDYDTQLQGEDWYLLNNVEGVQYKISELLAAAQENAKLYQESQKTVSSQKIAIIVLVVLAAGLGLVVTVLIFKIKDVMDEAYFKAVEKDTMRQRGDGKNKTGSNKNVMHTVGNRTGAAPQKSGTGNTVSPGGSRDNGAKPAGSGSGLKTSVPQYKNPSGAQTKQKSREQAVQKTQAQPAKQEQGWKSKNFMADDDEFEFEFLNWDGEEN